MTCGIFDESMQDCPRQLADKAGHEVAISPWKVTRETSTVCSLHLSEVSMAEVGFWSCDLENLKVSSYLKADNAIEVRIVLITGN
jgi:hypothetical protein